MVEKLACEEGQRYLLTPNRSLSWRGNLRIWTALFLLSAAIVTGLSILGAWVILPFAGLELAALAAGFYATSRYCQRQEVLALEPGIVRVEKGARRKESEWTFPRQYTRLMQDEPRHPFTPAKLSIQFRDQEVPIGQFLNIEDTEALIGIFERSGLAIQKRKAREPMWFWR